MGFRVSDGNFLEQILELAAGYGIGNTVSAALEPLVQSERNTLWTLDPSLPTDAQTLALLVRMGIIDEAVAIAESEKSGTGGDSLRRYIRAAASVPSADVLIELARRKELGDGSLVDALKQAGVDERYVERVAALERTLLSPQEAALLRQRGHLTAAEQHAIAALAGVDEADAERQYLGSGISMGVGEALELVRRGEMSAARFQQVVAEGDTRIEWTPDLLKLVHQPLSPAVAAEALVRERPLPRPAHYYAQAAGLSPEDFDAWVNMLGRPMAIGEALTLVRRGELSAAGFREVVARSDVRTQYAPDLLKLTTVYPPLFQVLRLVAANAIPDAYAVQILQKEGYEPKLAESVVQAGHTTKRSGHKAISLSIAETLYESGLEGRDWFDHALTVLGYDDADRTELENLLEVRRLVGEITHALTMLRTRYVSWKIGRDVVVHELDTLLTDGDVRDRLLTLWDMEREANRPVLTKGEVGQALRYGRFTVDEAVQHWVELGHSPDDAVTHAWIVLKRDPYQSAS